MSVTHPETYMHWQLLIFVARIRCIVIVPINAIPTVPIKCDPLVVATAASTSILKHAVHALVSKATTRGPYCTHSKGRAGMNYSMRSLLASKHFRPRMRPIMHSNQQVWACEHARHSVFSPTGQAT